MEMQMLMEMQGRQSATVTIDGLRFKAGDKQGEQAMSCLNSPICLSLACGRTPSARKGVPLSLMPCGPTAPSGSWSKSHGPQKGVNAAVTGAVPDSVCDLCPLSPASSLAANLLYDDGGKAIALAMKENRALKSLQ